jgi:hypothetical protein
LKELRAKLSDAQAQLRAEKASCARAEEALGAERTARLEAEKRYTAAAAEIKRANAVVPAPAKPSNRSWHVEIDSRDRQGFSKSFTLTPEDLH